MNVRKENNPHWIIQLLWFLLVGWWAGEIWMTVAWVLMLTVIGLPIGLGMINNVSRVLALRTPSHQLDDLRGEPERQRFFLVRVVYFLLIGWWASFIWMQAALFLCATIIGLPIGFRMFDKTPAVMTLKR